MGGGAAPCEAGVTVRPAGPVLGLPAQEQSGGELLLLWLPGHLVSEDVTVLQVQTVVP
ncbi:hypothetical protein DPMN_125738 [Dreissena polymorpha]|uniref:Uncharacterized protein n=1 Tax=Dreissena polymorpha TaxID=45954 RepID=A0A9D4GVU4_DREPO|nr:hypothetical protein DPMN_125738 [Dreissena polymorpha]